MAVVFPVTNTRMFFKLVLMYVCRIFQNYVIRVFLFVVFLPFEVFTYWLEHALLLGIPIYLIRVGKISVPQISFKDTLGWGNRKLKILFYRVYF